MENLNLLLAAKNEKNVDALREAVAHISKRAAAPILAELLPEDWHDSHEDIVVELGLTGDTSSTIPIAKTILIPFNHLIKWGNFYEFQHKCAYALARIGTPDSQVELTAIAKHADSYLKAYGEEGLQHWPMACDGNEYI